MVNNYGVVVRNCIEAEKTGRDYQCTDLDRTVLDRMFEELNKELDTDFHYLAEIDLLRIEGSGNIMIKYIDCISSESVRSFLIPQIVQDRVENIDLLLLKWYQRFKHSEEYNTKPGQYSPAHIYVRYDNAFYSLKSKRIKNELVELVHEPLDAYYLPFTVRMLAKWKVPLIKDILISYLKGNNVSLENLGIICNTEKDIWLYDQIIRNLKFTAIYGLRYYPSPEILHLINEIIDCNDIDVKTAAIKTLKILKKTNKQH